MMEFLRAETDGPTATRALAAAVAGCLADGDLIVLSGDLGAGKTCFTQGLGAGLGIDERITSPTFTLAARYHGRLWLNHLDVYRLDDIGETIDLDLPELLEDGVTVIEWGQRIDSVLPRDRLQIELRYDDVTPRSDADADAAIDAAAAADDAVADDRRTLVFQLGGPSWLARRELLEAAIEPWRTPC